LEPPISGGDDFFRVCASGEGFGFVQVVVFDKAGDGSFEFRDGSENTVFQPSSGQL
jgi:hypothetical protein